MVAGLSSAAVSASAPRTPISSRALRPYSARQLVVYSFRAGSDGALPAAGLTADKAGAFYGTTQAGGAKNLGTVFKLLFFGSGYQETVLHAFVGGKNDGALPMAGLIEDKSGALFGTTVEGGFESTKKGCEQPTYAGCGTIFKLTPTQSTGYIKSILYRFRGGTDAFLPFGGLIADKIGGLYGTTGFGGSSDAGTAFTLTPSAKGYRERILYSFPYSPSGPSFPDGLNPLGDLLADDSGALYGTTEWGGSCSTDPILGCGIVFKLTPSGSGYAVSILHEFHGGSDGSWPLAGLIADKGGALYGTTQYGGAANLGTAFKLTPSGSGYSESVLHAFAGGTDGALPAAALFLDKSGALYGTTSSGGLANEGTIFKLMRSGSTDTERVIHVFQGSPDGAEPVAGLVAGKAGMLYGTTMLGGASGVGAVFALKQ